MKKVKVRLLQLGYPPIDLTKVALWKSEYFEFDKGIYYKRSLPNSDGDGWSYSKKLLSKIVGGGDEADITIGVTDKPIQDNYYLHRLSEKTCVLSLFEISNILAIENIPVEIFFILNVYEIVLLYWEFDRKISSNAYVVHHEDTRGCLFDFNPIKTDIIASTKQASLCEECRARLSKKPLPIGFVDGFVNELKRIKKPLIFKILDFVKEYPVWSFVISFCIAVIANLISNYFYDLLFKNGIK